MAPAAPSTGPLAGSPTWSRRRAPLSRGALAALLAACAAVASGTALRAAPLEEYVAHAPFPMAAVPVPAFPARTFNVGDYGAVGDGRTLNTAAFARAIAACAAAGGGHVLIPPGLWLTGPIALCSHLDLHAERGALIQFTADHTAYPLVTRGEHGFATTSPLTGIGLHDVALTGEGIYDGAGETWRPVKKDKTTAAQWRALLALGGATSNGGTVWWPTRAAMDGEDYLAALSRRTAHPTAEELLPGRDFRRPYLLYLEDCDTVIVEGVTLRNSPMYVFEPLRCAHLTIRGVTIFNEWWAQNGDGLDISACHDVVVYRCIVNAGDDGICMKSSGSRGSGEDAALQRVIVAECTVYRAHGGFSIGSNTDAGMRDLWATHCTFIGTDVGIRVKSGLGRGGLVRAVTIDHIAMKDIANEAILFDTYYENVPASAATLRVAVQKDERKVPEFRDFLIRDIDCLGAGTAIAITGLPQSPVHGITIEDAVISARRGLHARNAADILLRRVQITTPESPAVTTRDVSNLRFVN